MSANTFFNFATWVNSEIQSAQLAKTNAVLQTQLSSMSEALNGQSKEQEHVNRLRELVFTIKQQLSEVLDVIEESPLEALVFYLNSVQAFSAVNPSLFQSFEDKEYVNEVRKLVVQLEGLVLSQYDPELVKAIPEYSAIDSLFADLKVRRFFLEASKLWRSKNYRSFFGVKESYVSDLKMYCLEDFSESFWNAYVNSELPGRVAQTVASRMTAITRSSPDFKRKLEVANELRVLNHENAIEIRKMEGKDLEALEAVIFDWLTDTKSSAATIGLTLPDAGTVFRNRIEKSI